MVQYLRRNLDLFLVLLIAADIFFIVVHGFHIYTGFFSETYFNIEEDRSAAEGYQYVKEYWIFLMFGWMTLVLAEWRYAIWSVLFGYFLADDAVLVREKLGMALSKRLGFGDTFGLRPEDLGELIVVAVSGLALLVALAIAYSRGDPVFRQVTRRMIALLVILALFGAALDAIHILFMDRPGEQPLGMIEDGGEMVVMSVICWYVLTLLRRMTGSKAGGYPPP